MNKTLFGIVSACLLLAASAQAQNYKATAVITGTTNNVTALGTNTFTKAIDVTGYSEIGFALSYKQATAGSSNITVRLARSLDASTWETVPSIIVFCNSTNFVTNISGIGAVGHVRVATVENTNALAITNVTVTYSIKPRTRP